MVTFVTKHDRREFQSPFMPSVSDMHCHACTKTESWVCASTSVRTRAHRVCALHGAQQGRVCGKAT